MGAALFPLTFNRANIQPSWTDVRLYIDLDVADSLEHLLPFDCSLMALTIIVSSAPSAGSADFRVRRNGTILPAASLAVDSSGRLARLLLAGGPIAFQGGDRLDLVVTTDASWAPSTLDCVATAWFQQGGLEE